MLSSDVSMEDYRKLEINQDKEAIVNFIRQRFTERYITPMKTDLQKKNGFTIMAISCLMIETLESFYQGWSDTKNKSQWAFCNFFDRSKKFHFIKGHSQSFYKNVRCGILHQGETTGGWHIRRRGAIFDKVTNTVNAKKFHDEIEESLSDYCEELRASEWSAPIWKAFRKKMESVCKNCEQA